jgi:hypothetical protein
MTVSDVYIYCRNLDVFSNIVIIKDDEIIYDGDYLDLDFSIEMKQIVGFSIRDKDLYCVLK